jgi:hypothetical protein
MEDIEKLCMRCKRKISEQPATGRFHTIILYGPECAWNPDNEVKDFVAQTLEHSGYDLRNLLPSYLTESNPQENNWNNN